MALLLRRAAASVFPVGVNATQDQAPTLSRQVIRSNSVGQGQSLGVGLALARLVPAMAQGQVPSSRLAVSRGAAGSQDQASSSSLAANRIAPVSQGQAASLGSRQLARFVSVAQAQPPAIQKAASRLVAGSQGSTPSSVLQRPRTVSFAQGQSAAMNRVAARNVVTSMPQATSAGRVVGRVAPALQAQGPLIQRRITRTLVAASGEYATLIKAGNPVSYWRLDEASGTVASDQQGANNGTYGGTLTLGQAGALIGDPNKSVLLSGGSVNVPDAASLRLIGDMTIEMWVKPTSLVGNVELAGKGAGNFASPYVWYLVSGLPGVNIGNGSTSTGINAITGLGTNAWYHVAVVISGSTVYHYLNGQPNGSGSIAGQARADGGQALLLGGKSLFWVGALPGYIDEAAIYNYALSGDQVFSHYKVGSGGQYAAPSVTLRVTRSLVATQGQSPSVVHGKAYTVSVATSQAQGASANRVVGRGVVAAAPQVTSVARAASRTASVLQAQGSSVVRRVTRILTASVPYSLLIQADNPTSYWRLDETSGTVAADQQGANNGTYSAAVGGGTGVASVAGLLTSDSDTAIALSSGRIITLGNSASLQLANGTLECWFSTTAPNNSAYLTLIGKSGAWWLGRLNSNKLGFYDYGGGGGNRDSGVSINDGKTHHVVLAFQSGVTNGTRLYLDGQLVLTSTMTVGNQATGPGIAHNGAGAQVLPGTFDEVAIYNYPLSTAQVTAHYGAGSPGQYASGSIVRGVRRALAYSQASSPAAARSLARSAQATLGQAGVIGRAVSRMLSGNQDTASSVTRRLARTQAATQSCTSSSVLSVSRRVQSTTGQIGYLIRQPARRVTITQPVSAVVMRAMSRSHVSSQAQQSSVSRRIGIVALALQNQTGSIVVVPHAHAVNLTATQPQIASISISLGHARVLTTTQSTNGILGKAFSKVFAVAQAQQLDIDLQVYRVGPPSHIVPTLPGHILWYMPSGHLASSSAGHTSPPGNAGHLITTSPGHIA